MFWPKDLLLLELVEWVLLEMSMFKFLISEDFAQCTFLTL